MESQMLDLTEIIPEGTDKQENIILVDSHGLPIEVPTWFVLDSTKMQDYMSCPRSFFFKYVLGWRPASPNKHLHFGTAWHLAMETLLLEGYSAQAVLNAYKKFEKKYREKFPEVTDAENYPKVPGVVLQVLPRYTMQYQKDLEDTPLYTEIAGSVVIGYNRLIYFKMDSILARPSKMVFSREHKTGSRNSRQWQDKFKIGMQTGTYNHVLCCLMSPEQVEGIEINGAIFTKKNLAEFIRVPVRRTLPMMNAWLSNTNAWCDDIERDFQKLSKEDPNSPCMGCFKQNTESCTDYYGCEFFDFCLSWPNPLQHLGSVPLGMMVEHWDPRTQIAEAKTKLEGLQ